MYTSYSMHNFKGSLIGGGRLNMLIFHPSQSSPGSAVGVSGGRPVCTASCSLAGSEPRASPPSSAGTGTDHGERQLQSDIHYKKFTRFCMSIGVKKLQKKM